MKTIEEILGELDVPALSGGAPQRIFKEILLVLQAIEKRVAELERNLPGRDAANDVLDDPPN